MATFTSTVYKGNVAKFYQTGNVSVSGQFSWAAVVGAAASVGDVVFLAKVPHGAKIVDFYEYHSANASAMAVNVGFDRGVAAGGGSGVSCLISSGAQATMNRLSLATSPAAGNAPLTLSLSDLDTVRYAALQATIVGPNTGTTSVFINFNLIYRFDGPDPK